MYTKIKRIWFKTTFWIALFAALLSGGLSASFRTEVLAQDATQDTSEVFITVTNPDQINVRNGPDTQLYDIIGHMQPGETAVVLGVSPGRDWIQIVFPDAPGGVAWVFAPLVSLSPGNLRIIEPPPVTPTITITTDPTLIAAYIFEPTVTRMPTFTPPPPLEIPKFTAAPNATAKSGVPMGALVIGSGTLGLLGYLLSLLRKR